MGCQPHAHHTHRGRDTRTIDNIIWDRMANPVPLLWCLYATGLFGFRCYRLLPALTPYDAEGTQGFTHGLRDSNPRMPGLEAGAFAAWRSPLV